MRILRNIVIGEECLTRIIPGDEYKGGSEIPKGNEEKNSEGDRREYIIALAKKYNHRILY